jgi:hypothetical protein
VTTTVIVHNPVPLDLELVLFKLGFEPTVLTDRVTVFFSLPPNDELEQGVTP